MAQSSTQGVTRSPSALDLDTIQIGGAFTAPKIQPKAPTPEVEPFDDFEPEFFSRETPKTPSEKQSLDETNKQLKQNADIAKGTQIALAGAELFINVMNANSQYNAIEGQAKMNIFLATQSASDAISRGAGRSLARKQEGKRAGEASLASLAAQGIDVSSAGAQRASASQEAVGIYNGMLEEINASREALGFEQQIVQFNFDIDQADIQRDSAIIGSVLDFGASVAPTAATFF